MGITLPLKVRQYAKGIVAVLAALAVPAQAALDDGHISSDEIVAIVIVGLGAAGVIAVPNAATDKQIAEAADELKVRPMFVPADWHQE